MEANKLNDAERAAAVEDELAAARAAAHGHLEVVANLKKEIKRLTAGLAGPVTGAALGPHYDALPDGVGAGDQVPGLSYPTTFADLARITPEALWNRYTSGNPWPDAKTAFMDSRTIHSARTAPADRPSDTGGAIPTWQERLGDGWAVAHTALREDTRDCEIRDLRAALASKGDTGGDLSAAAFEDIFESWDGCMYDAPGENIDIGAALRIDIGKLLATAPRAAIPARDAALEEAAQAVVGMGSTDPIMSYGQLCAEAIRALKGVAAIPAAGSSAHVHTWKHAANEWADTAYNGLQHLRNIVDGISTAQASLENMEVCCKRARDVADKVGEMDRAAPAKDRA